MECCTLLYVVRFYVICFFVEDSSVTVITSRQWAIEKKIILKIFLFLDLVKMFFRRLFFFDVSMGKLKTANQKNVVNEDVFYCVDMWII